MALTACVLAALVWLGLGGLCSAARAQDSDLERARAALAAAEFARARQLALAHLQAHPGDLDAAVVAGLAEFHSGEYEAALSHFDEALAGQGSEAPIALQFNRASCLYALGRFAEAESAFAAVAATADPPLAALASLNAGFCAVELGSAGRAAQHRDRAHMLDRDEQLAAHIAELDADVAALDPGRRTPSPEPPPAASQARVAEASATPGSALDAVSGGGVGASVALGGGYDSNATQAGVNQSGITTALDEARLRSAYGRASGSLFAGIALSPRLSLLAQYDLDQLAHARSELDFYAAQDHSLELQLEQRLPLGLRVGMTARGLLSFAGLRSFALLSAGYGGEIGVRADHTEHWQSALRGGLFRSEMTQDAYAFLTGTRFELIASERYQREAVHVRLSVLYRDERLGIEQLAVTPPAGLCTLCDAAYDLPLGYRAARVSLDGRVPLGWVLSLAARASLEWRENAADSRLRVTRLSQTSTLWSQRERQQRFELRTDLVFDLPAGLAVDVGYDLGIADTNFDDGDATGAFGPPNRDFTRHRVEASVSADF